MKSLLGFKARAQTAVQEQFDRVSAQSSRNKPSFGLQPAQVQPEDDFEGGLEARAASSHSATSARDTALAQQAASAAEKKGAVDPIIQQLLKNARSEAVRQEFLSMPQGEYTSKHDIEVLAGTYNVNGRRPPADLDLRPWLDMANQQADIVAVGFQEVVLLNAGNVVMGGGLEAGSVWDMHIDRALNNPLSLPSKPGSVTPSEKSSSSMGKPIPEESAGSKHDDATQQKPAVSSRSPSASAPDSAHMAANVFVQVAAKQMVGVYLSVWVRRGILPHVRGVQVTSVGTGMMGYLGNKGAVAARLRVYDSGICFVCAHLASGENEGDELKRNYDYSEIVRRGQFPPDSASLDPDTSFSGASEAASQASGDGRGPGQWGSQRGFLDNEHAVWMGDLNYRLTIPDEQARSLIREAKLDNLLEGDELVNMVRDSRAFSGWTEGHITFPPTFKFKRGTSQYLGMDDDDESEQVERMGPNGSPDKAQGQLPKEKKRTPAWTDRILYKSPAGLAKQTYYSSANLLVSDHKPVSCRLSLTVREYVRDVVEAAVDTARRTVDAREMAAMPRCELEPTSAEIGEAFYGQEKKVHLVLRNSGQVTANFQFMPLPGAMFGDDKDKKFRTAPRWATIQPEQGVLEPGSGQEVTLTVWINGGLKGTAQLAAAAQECKLEAILVLRIQDGNDIFVSVAGKYLPSFFGVSLQCLSSLPRPLVPSAQAAEVSNQGGGLRISTAKGKAGVNRDSLDEQPGSEAFYSPSASHDASPASSSHHSPDHADAQKHLQRNAVGQEAPQSQDPTHASTLPATGGDAGVGARGGHQPDPSQQPAASSALTSSQEAAQSSGSDSSATPRLPPELRAITTFLKDKERLKTAGLFVNSADAAMLWAMHQPSEQSAAESNREPKAGCALAVKQVREALDRGQEIPGTASAHDVAATLLAFFASLPSPFMPPAAAQVCDVCVPSSSAASSLLADSLSPAEWAVFRHISELLQEALSTDIAAANGLTSSGLAALFAEAWFPSLTPGYGAAGTATCGQEARDSPPTATRAVLAPSMDTGLDSANLLAIAKPVSNKGARAALDGGTGQNLKPEDVAELQRMAENVCLIADRRAAFIALFLEPAEAS